MEDYSIFESIRAMATQDGLQDAFAEYLFKVRGKDEWVDDMLDGCTKEVLAKDLLDGKYVMLKLLNDCIIDICKSDSNKINSIATHLFVSDKKALKQFLDIVYNECEVLKKKFKTIDWFKNANGKQLIDSIYADLKERFAITQRNTAESQNAKRLQWNGDTAALCSLLKDLSSLRTDKGLPFLSASPDALKDFICNNFLNNKGEEIPIGTADKNLRDKPSITGRLFISKTPPQGR